MSAVLRLSIYQPCTSSYNGNSVCAPQEWKDYAAILDQTSEAAQHSALSAIAVGGCQPDKSHSQREHRQGSSGHKGGTDEAGHIWTDQTDGTFCC